MLKRYFRLIEIKTGREEHTDKDMCDIATTLYKCFLYNCIENVRSLNPVRAFSLKHVRPDKLLDKVIRMVEENVNVVVRANSENEEAYTLTK